MKNILNSKIILLPTLHYFTLTAIGGLGNIFNISVLGKIGLLILLSGIFITIKYFFYEKIKPFDLFLIFFLTSLAFIGLFSSYPQELYWYGVRYQLALTLFYFVGKSSDFKDWTFFNNMKIPILVVAIIGLYLYFSPPSWYIAWKLSSTTKFSSESRILEMTRLSAFWEYPYWISYSAALLYHYIIYKMFWGGVSS